jgi:hypothetical protein
MKWAGARVVLADGGLKPGRVKGRGHHRGAVDTEFVNGAILAYLHDVAQGAAVRSLCGDDVKAIATLNLKSVTCPSPASVRCWAARVRR